MGQLLPYRPVLFKPLGFVSAEISTTDAVNLTLPDNAAGALVQCTGGNLHWTSDGEATPTSEIGSGMVLVADAEPSFFGPEIRFVKFIATAAGAHLLVSFYG